MCMHTTNKTDGHIFFLCLVCDQQLLQGSADRKLKTSCTWRPLDTERERDRHDERVRMKRKSVIKKKVGNTIYWDAEGQWKRKMDQWTWGWKVFGWWTECVRDDREKPVNMWYSNMDFSNVKHKKQSCRTCRTSVTQTFVSLYGFSVMYPPLGKECFWTLSFVTGFFFFFLCFYFFNSRFWLYSIWCTLYIYGDALCTVHSTIFCVMSGLRHWSSSLPH